MNGIDRHRYAMLVRVKQFGISHAERFPTETLDGRLFAALASAVDQATDFLTAHVRERTAARSGTASKAAARAALLAALGAFARMAKAFAADVPGLQGRFRRPSSDVNDLELLTVGRACLADAAPLAPHLTEHGLPLTSLADVQAALEAFEGAALNRLAACAARASARAGLTAALGAAGRALARLDAIVPNTLRAQPALLAAWKVARHVQRAVARRPAAPALQPQPQASEPITLVASAVIRSEIGERPSDVGERPTWVETAQQAGPSVVRRPRPLSLEGLRRPRPREDPQARRRGIPAPSSPARGAEPSSANHRPRTSSRSLPSSCWSGSPAPTSRAVRSAARAGRRSP